MMPSLNGNAEAARRRRHLPHVENVWQYLIKIVGSVNKRISEVFESQSEEVCPLLHISKKQVPFFQNTFLTELSQLQLL
jgi:hypothetical protein